MENTSISIVLHSAAEVISLKESDCLQGLHTTEKQSAQQGGHEDESYQQQLRQDGGKGSGDRLGQEGTQCLQLISAVATQVFEQFLMRTAFQHISGDASLADEECLCLQHRHHGDEDISAEQTTDIHQ